MGVRSAREMWPTVDFDFIEWDDEHHPRGNVLHIEAAGLIPKEVEEVLRGFGTETTSRAKFY